MLCRGDAATGFPSTYSRGAVESELMFHPKIFFIIKKKAAIAGSRRIRRRRSHRRSTSLRTWVVLLFQRMVTYEYLEIMHKCYYEEEKGYSRQNKRRVLSNVHCPILNEQPQISRYLIRP